VCVPTPLADLLAAHDVASGHVERAIFGARDADAIAALVAGIAEHHLGTPVAGGLFYAASAGCVFGLGLEDGRSVVLKAYQSHWERRFLCAVQRVQRAVAATGFPCPTPLSAPVAVGGGWATIESLLPDPGTDDRFDEGDLERSSAGLVALLHAARGLAPDGLELHPSRMAEGALYPIPHNPVFDLQGTAAGAEWIDEWARRAWPRRSSGTLRGVIAYLDWSARNVRMGPAGIVAVYDWDSISVASEATTAGQAAATWRSTGDTTDIGAPDAEEIARFVASFARALGRPFSGLETDVAHAAAVWVMAYAARCEHALEQRTPWRRTRAREWLATQAELLLS
jgi:hypothetical protein